MKQKIDLTRLNNELMPKVTEIQEKMKKIQERFNITMENFDFKSITAEELENFEDK